MFQVWNLEDHVIKQKVDTDSEDNAPSKTLAKSWWVKLPKV